MRSCLKRFQRAYSLTVHVEIDLRVIRRKDAVGGANDWAGSHDVGCVQVMFEGFCGSVDKR